MHLTVQSVVMSGVASFVGACDEERGPRDGALGQDNAGGSVFQGVTRTSRQVEKLLICK